MTNWPEPTPDIAAYIVGDIHGCAERLQALLAKIDEEMTARKDRAEIVFVGDYIDRGEHSADVLRFLYRIAVDYAGDVTCLAGNHERMMLEFLDDPVGRGPRWLRNGGAQTLASFGIAAPSTLGTVEGASLIDAAFDLRVAAGAGMLDWMSNLPTWWNSGNVWAVHAGADPAEPMDAQLDDMLVWGGEAFRASERDDGQWVVAGHVPVAAAGAAHGRIDVDTGAVYGGVLTAVALDPTGEIRFLQG